MPKAEMRCEHGFRVPCTVCDPYIASRAQAEGRPVATPSESRLSQTSTESQ